METRTIDTDNTAIKNELLLAGFEITGTTSNGTTSLRGIITNSLLNFQGGNNIEITREQEIFAALYFSAALTVNGFLVISVNYLEPNDDVTPFSEFKPDIIAHESELQLFTGYISDLVFLRNLLVSLKIQETIENQNTSYRSELVYELTGEVEEPISIENYFIQLQQPVIMQHLESVYQVIDGSEISDQKKAIYKATVNEFLSVLDIDAFMAFTLNLIEKLAPEYDYCKIGSLSDQISKSIGHDCENEYDDCSTFCASHDNCNCECDKTVEGITEG